LKQEPKLSIVIPIYNEIELIDEVLSRVRALDYKPKEVILVDDMSVDGTRELLQREEGVPNTTVLYHEKNFGKGMAIRTGLDVAAGDIIIIQDADMEYDPDDILKVIQPILDGRADVCYGSRFLGSIKRMRLANRVANYLLAFLVRVLYGRKITDEATAYKAFRRKVLSQIELDCTGFEFCPEITAKVLKLGCKILEVPVTFRARTFNEGKKIGWKDFFVAVWTLIKYRF